MPPDEPGQRPERPTSADYTRRRLLTAAGLIATAGAGDAAWKTLHRAAAAGTQRVTASAETGTAGAAGGRRVPAGSPSAHPAPTHPGSTTSPHPSGPPLARTPHPSPTASRARVEHLTLPPPTVPVRDRPAYTVHDLLPGAARRAVALTVDDGPDPEWTPKVLRLLDKVGVQATFCVVGVHVAAYPNLVRDIHRAGHAIVNHTWSHPLPFASLPERQIVAQITRNQAAIERAAKVTPQLFRAPGGEWSPFVYRALASYGLRPLDWDVDPVDWAEPGTRRITRRMLRARPGDIVLCHDGGGDRHETVRALRTVLPTWKRRGYDLVTLLLPEPTAPTPSPTPTPTLAGQPTVTATPSPSPRRVPPSPTASPTPSP